jgi:hypothetical protein
MRVGVGITALAVAVGCSATEGPLLHAIDAASVEDAAPAAGEGGSAGSAAMQPLAQDMAWQYQLVGDVDASIDAELFVIDLDETEEVLADLRAQNKVTVAYISAGTFEPWRTDTEQFPDAALGRPLDAYPNERWLDIRNQEVRALMAARLDRARNLGFAGVLPTSLTAHLNDTGFDLTAEDQRQYTEWFAQEARQRGLHVGMSSDFERLDVLGQHFDWAVQFSCVERADCARLDGFAAQGKAVFDVEFEGEPADVCARAAEYGVNAILKHQAFDAYRVGCL